MDAADPMGVSKHFRGVQESITHLRGDARIPGEQGRAPAGCTPVELRNPGQLIPSGLRRIPVEPDDRNLKAFNRRDSTGGFDAFPWNSRILVV